MPVITVDVVVDSLEEVLEFFDRIEVHRSTTVEGGPYTEITALGDPTPAQVDGSSSGPFNLDGLTLEFFLDLSSESKSVTFEGTDPIPLAEILTQINDVVPDLAFEVPTDTNRLRLTSTTVGTSSSITVVDGDAATALGLSTTKVNGKERRPRIVEPTVLYKIFDKDGSSAFWYKTRFSSSTSPLISEFSTPHLGGAVSAVPEDQLVKATIQLTTGNGSPVVGRRIIFLAVSRGVVATTSLNVLPGFDSRVEVLTNESGYAESNLLRGITYRVIFEGTSYMREFVAPLVGDTFDVLSIIGSSPDPFDIVQLPPKPLKVTI